MKKITGGVAFGNPFAAFKHRSYLYYWLGMAVSTMGTWMQNIAQPWLAYKLTDNALLLGLVGAMQFLPVLLFSLFAGVIIDRSNKKKVLYMTQTAAFLITMALAILTFSGHIQYWHLLISSTLMGFVNTFDMPARQSFVIELVGKEDLMNGIALNSVQFNLARMVGPALAGIIMGIGANGIPNCFLINSISYGAVLIGLVFVHPYPIEKQPKKEVNILKDIGDGIKFVFSRKVLYVTLAIVAVTGTFAMNFNVLVPVFANKVLHQQETGFGLLMSMSGLGALGGALTMAMISKGGPRMTYIYVCPLIVGALVLLVGFSNIYIVAGIILALVSYFNMIFMASANSTMQLNATNEYRGRVMSVYSLLFAGTSPLGSLYAGGLAQRFGPKIGFIADGAAVLVLLLPLFLFMRKKRKNAAKQTSGDAL